MQEGDFRAALFVARTVIEVTTAMRRVDLKETQRAGVTPGVSEMSHHQRPHELRLAISSAAEAFISDFGGEAYAEARRHAEEASSDFLARDWSEVARVVAYKTGRRSLLAWMFH